MSRPKAKDSTSHALLERTEAHLGTKEICRTGEQISKTRLL